MTGALVVLSTIGSAEEASRVANALVERGLAACVSVLPGLTSVYRWEARVQTETEFLMVIKTTAQAFEPLREALLALHPYEVPEILALPVADGHPPYLAWLTENVDARPG